MHPLCRRPPRPPAALRLQRGGFLRKDPPPRRSGRWAAGSGRPGSLTSRRGKSGSSCVKLCSTTGQLSGPPTSRRTASHTLRLRREPGNSGSAPPAGPAASAHIRCTMDGSQRRRRPAGPRDPRRRGQQRPARLGAACALRPPPGPAEVRPGAGPAPRRRGRRRGGVGPEMPRGVSCERGRPREPAGCVL